MFEVEMEGRTSRDYGRVHKAGCRDLQDGMPIGDASTLPELFGIFNDATGWDLLDDEIVLAPCARSKFVQQRYM